MELSVAQAAALVGRSPRAVRAWIASGRLAARKTERGWFVRSEELPLTEAQREQVQRRSENVRSAVDAALPSRAAMSRDRRSRSLLDLDVYRLLLEQVAGLQARGAALSASHEVLRATTLARRAAISLAEGLVERMPAPRLRHLLDARRMLGKALAHLHLCEEGKSHAVPFEQQILPMLGGLLRWSTRSATRSPRR
jgi:hypothetical protein